MLKKVIVPLALCLPTLAVHAQGNVTIFGLIDMSVAAQHAGSGVNRKVMDSSVGNGSRLGFRGNEDLGGGLSANFWLEMGIGADTGVLQQGNLAWGRQAWVGLSTKQWSLSAGRQYSPLWLSEIYSDATGQSYWGNSNLSGINVVSAAAAGDGTQGQMVRVNNSLLGTFTSAGFIGRLMVAAGDEAANSGGRMINPGFTWTSGPFGVTGSYYRSKQSVRDIPAGAAPAWQHAVTAGAQYDFGPAKLVFGYFAVDPSEKNITVTANTTLKQTNFNVGVVVPLTNSRVLAQVFSSRFDKVTGTDGRATTLAAVYEYYLSKRTTVYSSYAHVSNNNRSNLGLFSASGSFAASGVGQDPSILALGIRHTF